MEKKTDINERIKKLKSLMTSNAKDAKWMSKQIDELCVLHRQVCNEPVELIVPCKEVTDSIDFGACKISRTIRGYLFEAKGGMHTFVNLRMARVCAMINTLFTLHKKVAENKADAAETAMYEAFRDAILYVFQTPIFASLDEQTLFSIATDILRHFREYTDEHYTNVEAKDETEKDIKENIEFEQAAEGLEYLVNNETKEDSSEI